ncbi:uncharacterized protein [Hetaerina americana]
MFSGSRSVRVVSDEPSPPQFDTSGAVEELGRLGREEGEEEEEEEVEEFVRGRRVPQGGGGGGGKWWWRWRRSLWWRRGRGRRMCAGKGRMKVLPPPQRIPSALSVATTATSSALHHHKGADDGPSSPVSVTRRRQCGGDTSDGGGGYFYDHLGTSPPEEEGGGGEGYDEEEGGGPPEEEEQEEAVVLGNRRGRRIGGGKGTLESVCVVSEGGLEVPGTSSAWGHPRLAGPSNANGPQSIAYGSPSSRMIADRLSSSGNRLDASPGGGGGGAFVVGVGAVSGGVVSAGGKSSAESVVRAGGGGKSVSKQSLLDLVSCRLGVGGGGGGFGGGGGGGFGGGNRKRSAAYVNRAHVASELDLSRKARGEGGGGGSGGGPGGGAGRGRRGGGPGRLDASYASSVGAASHSCGDAYRHHNQQVAGRRRRGAVSTQGTLVGGTSGGGALGSGGTTSSSNRCRWSFVFDPAGRLCYYWSMVVSLAFLYNFWAVIYRFAFQEIDMDSLVVWFCLDYLSDFLYLADIVFHFRTGYLEDGVLQTDSAKLRSHYMNSTTFYIDCLCLLPLDFLYLSVGFNSILRSFRLVKIYRFWGFMDRTERHTNYPNLFRALSLIHYLLVIFHWNGCLYHIISKNNGFGSKNWVFDDHYVGHQQPDVAKQYLQSYYWCTLALTTIGDLPRPRSKGEYLFVIAQLLFGLMLFATVLGHVANIVTSVSAARKEFQAKLDGVKTYMRMRRVPNHLQVKVIKWFDYLWLTQKCSDEEKAVSCLPDKLKAEIAINVHLDTLKRVEIFQNTEAGFLCELVLRLRPVLFSPGDYICRKGEVGKEMYIVNRGRLQVVADNGRTVLATLKAGSYFGEISILNMGTAGRSLGNRRTASVRSVGYSDLFVLSKKDMWDVLKEYPAARVRLEAIAVKRLEKYRRAPLEKVAMGRSHSTPGLVESRGRIPIEDMWLSPVSPVGAAAALAPGGSLTAGLGGGGPHSIAPSTGYSANSLFSPGGSPSSRSHGAHARTMESPLSGTSSAGARSSEEEEQRRTLQAGVPHPLHPLLPTPAPPSQQLTSAAVGSLTGTLPPHLPPPGVHLHAAPPVVQALHPAHLLANTVPPHPHLRPVPGVATSSAGGVVVGAASWVPADAVMAGAGTSPSSSSHDALIAEITRLRERLITLEAENASLSVKLSQQQWDVEHRLAEIEMHICGGSSAGSTTNTDDNNERNRESII